MAASAALTGIAEAAQAAEIRIIGVWVWSSE
jgi:hypothetical protein